MHYHGTPLLIFSCSDDGNEGRKKVHVSQIIMKVKQRDLAARRNMNERGTRHERNTMNLNVKSPQNEKVIVKCHSWLKLKQSLGSKKTIHKTIKRGHDEKITCTA